MARDELFDQDQVRQPDDLDVFLESIKEDLKQDTQNADALFSYPAEDNVEYTDLEADSMETENESPRRGLPSVLKAVLYVCFILVVSILLAVFAWKCADEVCALTAEETSVTVTVSDNASISEVARSLKEKGLIRYPWLFQLYCMLSDAEKKIDPGTYTLNTVYDYRALVYGMVKTGENRATVTVTVPEGYELDDIFQMLEQMQVCDAESLRETASDYLFDFWFLENIAYGDYRRLEGYLFPDTYEFYVNDAPERVLGKFLKNFDYKVTDEMISAVDSLNAYLYENMEENGFSAEDRAGAELTFHDVVIVASLVEKETSGAAESGRIASVIYNRLSSQVYPCLNIDATIQYVLPERKDILSNADKAVISPYNTYTNAGLPVGPISNPGLNSLRAALYPVDTEFYFYALDPSGVHHFSETVYEHQAYLDSLLGTSDTKEPAEEEVSSEDSSEEGLEQQP